MTTITAIVPNSAYDVSVNNNFTITGTDFPETKLSYTNIDIDTSIRYAELFQNKIVASEYLDKIYCFYNDNGLLVLNRYINEVYDSIITPPTYDQGTVVTMTCDYTGEKLFFQTSSKMYFSQNRGTDWTTYEIPSFVSAKMTWFSNAIFGVKQEYFPASWPPEYKFSIVKSHDNITWEVLFAPYFTSLGKPRAGYIMRDIDGLTDGSVIYQTGYSGDGTHVYKSVDKGNTWVDASTINPDLGSLGYIMMSDVCDSHYEGVSLLLHFDGADGSTVIEDAGPNNVSLTSINGAQLSTTTSKFGPSSAYFNASGYISASPSSLWNMGSGDFTIELWFKTTQSNAAYATLASCGSFNFGVGSWSIMHCGSTGVGQPHIYWRDYSSFYPFLVSGSTGYNDGNWHHLAWVRHGNTHILFLDGVSQATQTTATAMVDSGSPLIIGNDVILGGRNYLGYIDEVRITKGAARYSSSFTLASRQFYNASILLVGMQSSSNHIMYSANGGTTWVDTSIYTNYTSKTVSKSGRLALVASGIDGNSVLRSTNQFDTWDLYTFSEYRDVTFTRQCCDYSGQYCVVNTTRLSDPWDGTIYHHILLSTDYGETWNTILMNTNYPLTYATMSDDGQAIYVTRQFELLRSLDHGQTWQVIKTSTYQSDLHAHPGVNGKLIIQLYAEDLIYISQDYGSTYVLKERMSLSSYLWFVTATDTVYACSSPTSLYRGDDYFNNAIKPITMRATNDNFDVSNDGRHFTFATDTSSFYTNDGGKTWTMSDISSLIPVNFTSVNNIDVGYDDNMTSVLKADVKLRIKNIGSIGDTNFKDDSSYNHSVIVTGNTNIQLVDERHCAYFDGSGDRLSIASSAAFNLSTPHTFEVWIYPTAFPASGRYCRVWMFGINDQQTSFCAVVIGYDGTIAAGVPHFTKSGLYSAAGVIQLNTWQHIAVISDSNNGKIFVNGSLVASGVMSAPDSSAANTCYFGYDTSGIAFVDEQYRGYLTDAQVTSGVRYVGNFAVDQHPVYLRLVALNGDVEIYKSEDLSNTWNTTTFSGPMNSNPVTIGTTLYQRTAWDTIIPRNIRMSQDNGTTWIMIDDYTDTRSLKESIAGYDNYAVIVSPGVRKLSAISDIGITDVFIGNKLIGYTRQSSTTLTSTVDFYDNIADHTPVDVTMTLSDNTTIVLPASFTFLGYYYAATTPDPARSIIQGGSLFTVTGDFFDANTKVLIDGNPCVVDVIDANTMHVTSIEHPTGQYAIELGSALEPSYIKYLTDIIYADTAFEIISLSSNRSTTGGGKQITITGLGFDDTCTVFIGDKQATIISLTPTQIVITVPPNLPGLYALRIRKLQTTYDEVAGFRLASPDGLLGWGWCNSSSTGNDLITVGMNYVGSNISDPSTAVVYRSSDRGITWSYISTVTNFDRPYNFSSAHATYASPDLSKIFCVGSKFIPIDPEKPNAPTFTDEIIYSSDGGVTWSTLPTPLDSTLIDIGSGVFRCHTILNHYYTSKNAQYQVIIVTDNTTIPPAFKLFVSTEFGQTWTMKDTRTANDWGWSPSCAVISNTGDRIVLLGYDNVATVSNDGGDTWTTYPLPAEVTNGFDIWTICADSTVTSILIMIMGSSTYQTILTSRDGGQTWNFGIDDIIKAFTTQAGTSCDFRTRMILGAQGE